MHPARSSLEQIVRTKRQLPSTSEEREGVGKEAKRLKGHIV